MYIATNTKNSHFTWFVKHCTILNFHHEHNIGVNLAIDKSLDVDSYNSNLHKMLYWMLYDHLYVYRNHLLITFAKTGRYELKGFCVCVYLVVDKLLDVARDISSM